MLLFRLGILICGSLLCWSEAVSTRGSGDGGAAREEGEGVTGVPSNSNAKNEQVQDNFTLTLETCPVLIAEIAFTCINTRIHTCANKCGSYHHMLSGVVCSCDSLCKIYDDCCWDFETECPKIFQDAQTTKASYPGLMIACAPAAGGNYFFVDGCLDSTTSASFSDLQEIGTATQMPFHVLSKVTNINYWNLQSFLCGEGDHPYRDIWNNSNRPTLLRRCDNMVSFQCVTDGDTDPFNCVWNNNLFFELGRICSVFSEGALNHFMTTATTDRKVVPSRQLQEPRSNYGEIEVTKGRSSFNLRESSFKQMCFLNPERSPSFRVLGNIVRIRNFGAFVQMDSSVANYIWGRFFCAKNEQAHGAKCVQSKFVRLYLNYFYDPGICSLIHFRNLILRRILLLNVNGLKLVRRQPPETPKESRRQGIMLSFEVLSERQNVTGSVYLEKELHIYLKTSAPEWLSTAEVCVQYVDYSCKITYRNTNTKSESQLTPEGNSSLYNHVDCETLRQNGTQEHTTKPFGCDSENLYILLVCFPDFKDEIFQGWGVSALISAERKLQKNTGARGGPNWSLVLLTSISLLAQIMDYYLGIIQ